MGFQLDKPHKVYIFAPTLKLVSISRESEKAAKNLYGSYPTEFVFEVKNEN
jgi:hypothetical protein